jgi:hypothetical protein
MASAAIRIASCAVHDALHRIEARRCRRMVILGQSVDLLDIEDGVALWEAHPPFGVLAGRLLVGEIRNLERQLLVWNRADGTSQRLRTIPGIGIVTVTALAASIPDPAVFKTGRQFAAFLGLVPRQNPSGGKDRLGRISKMGDGYLRRLLVVGAPSVARRAGSNTSATATWVRGLLSHKPSRVVTLATANKTARIAWAILAQGRTYRALRYA